jgi:hypothetical protein
MELGINVVEKYFVEDQLLLIMGNLQHILDLGYYVVKGVRATLPCCNTNGSYSSNFGMCPFDK